MAKFNQCASGDFTFYTRPQTPHCGLELSHFPRKVSVSYTVRLRYDSASLDANGFLLDNTFFRDYFASFACAQVNISCENFARLIATDLCRISHCISCEVRLSPFNGVSVGYKTRKASA